MTRPSTQHTFGSSLQTRPGSPAGEGPGAELTLRDVVLQPQEILALYASEAQLERGNTVTLHSIQCQNQNIFLTVDTTCPLHRAVPPSQPGPGQQQAGQQAQEVEQEGGGMEGVGGEADRSVVPDWLQAELAEAAGEEKGRRRKEKKKKHRHRGGGGAEGGVEGGAGHPHAVPGEELERLRRLEVQYERRQQEILMEAELAVQVRNTEYQHTCTLSST